MATQTKLRKHEITEALRLSSSPEAKMVVELVKIMNEDAKTRLVTAEDNSLLRLQGEAQALDRLYKQLTVNPLKQES